MAIGLYSGLVNYEDQFYGGMVEKIVSNAAVFNGASNNAFRLISQSAMGNYNKEAFFDRVSDLITRQDITSSSAVTPSSVTQDEIIGVKLHRKIGPAMHARKAFKMIETDPGLFFFLLGGMAAEEITKNMTTSAIAAIEGALDDQSDLEYDNTVNTTKTLSYLGLTKGLAQMGDAGQDVKCWLMHSKSFYDLMADTLQNYKFDKVAGTTIYGGSIPTLGRPVIVVDNSYLVSGSNYFTLGLTEGAVTVIESEAREFNFEDMVSGYEQLMIRYQGELAFNIVIKGCEYTTSVGANPTDANLNATGSWTSNMASYKNLGGVRIITE